MIYIDPPYNTGSDGFVYNDDRKFTVKELQNLIGIDEEKAKRILDFTQSKSNSHSAWLTFMYPRLYIAKQLLRDDGVIFVSIDDNEVAQLRLLMDEIFGEENFVADIIWNSRKSVSNDTIISLNHNHTLFFSKDISFLQENKSDYRLLATEDKFSNPDNDPRGNWVADPFDAPNIRPNLTYPIENPNTREIYMPPKGRCWRTTKEEYEKFLSEGRIVFGKTGKSKPQLKRYFSEAEQKGVVAKSIWDDVGTTTNGTQELEAIIGEKVFDNPKPVSFISRILEIATSKNSIILDFFAGSGTTGDAVMQLNAEDGGNRKFILVQLPELIDPKKNKSAYDFVLTLNEKAIEKISTRVDGEVISMAAEPQLQYGKQPTIFEITKERLLRAAKKINSELDEKTQKLKLKIQNLESQIQTEETKQEIENLQEQITQNSNLKTQNYFKIFETTPIWKDYDFEAEEFNSSQTLFDTSKLTEDDIKALLVTWKTYDGIALTQDLESVDLGGYTAYYGSNKLYLMHKGFTTDSLKALFQKIDTDKKFNPTSIIAFGYHFESKNLRELSENVKTYSNKKNIDIDFITRY